MGSHVDVVADGDKSSYLPNPGKVYKYAYYEGIGEFKFRSISNGNYYWDYVYSYGGEQYSTFYYHEDGTGLYIGNEKENYYLTELKYPIAVGKSWSQKDPYTGEKITTEIISTTETVKIKSGTYKNCVVTKDTKGNYRYYAMDVGLIKIDQPELPYDSPNYTELVSLVPTKIMWGEHELKKGQIGKITVQKPINLWKRQDDKLEFVRILKQSEVYRVYGYDTKFGGQYSLGAGYYITNMNGYILYQTPSKHLLELNQTY
jgi:hypothetical protein